jgi:hypothetical protein
MATLAQQKLTQAMFGAQLIGFGVGSRAYKAAQRLVRLVGYPHRGEITTAQQAGELERSLLAASS